MGEIDSATFPDNGSYSTHKSEEALPESKVALQLQDAASHCTCTREDCSRLVMAARDAVNFLRIQQTLDYWRKIAKIYQRDAGRYQFLRTQPHNTREPKISAIWPDGTGVVFTPEACDEAVDAAMDKAIDGGT